MKFKKILMTLAILGALNACTNASKNIPQVKISDKVTAVQKNKIVKNYQKLSSSANSWLISKSNTKRIHAALKCVLSTRRGQELLYTVNRVPGIDVAFCTDEDTMGTYSQAISGPLVSFQSEYLKQNTPEENAIILMHELMHRVQDEKNLYFKEYFSIEQGAIIEKLCEAEAFAWDEVMKATFLYKTAYPNAIDVKGLTPSIALEVGRKKAIREKRKFNEAAFMQSDPLYKLALAMVASGGNVERAEKMVVGKTIQQCMAKNCDRFVVRNWRNHYDVHAYRKASLSIYMYYMTTVGNDKVFNKTLDYYSKTYGIDKSSINKLYLTEGAIAYKKRMVDHDLTYRVLNGYNRKFLRYQNRFSKIKEAKSVE